LRGFGQSGTAATALGTEWAVVGVIAHKGLTRLSKADKRYVEHWGLSLTHSFDRFVVLKLTDLDLNAPVFVEVLLFGDAYVRFSKLEEVCLFRCHFCFGRHGFWSGCAHCHSFATDYAGQGSDVCLIAHFSANRVRQEAGKDGRDVTISTFGGEQIFKIANARFMGHCKGIKQKDGLVCGAVINTCATVPCDVRAARD
jgi:hypothetical protein